MTLRRKQIATGPGKAAALVALLLAVALGACARDNHADRSCSTSAAQPGDVVGGGGCLDERYREIYHPGRGTDFGA
jgi:hypothetical protein